jgi:hypothetical protein
VEYFHCQRYRHQCVDVGTEGLAYSQCQRRANTFAATLQAIDDRVVETLRASMQRESCQGVVDKFEIFVGRSNHIYKGRAFLYNLQESAKLSNLATRKIIIMDQLPQDPIILLSVVNTWLRDRYESLDELCRANDIDPTELTDRLLKVGFTYSETTNQFI